MSETAIQVSGLVKYFGGRCVLTGENCGNKRRPEQSDCHHCQADWDMANIVVPDWRVVN